MMKMKFTAVSFLTAIMVWGSTMSLLANADSIRAIESRIDYAIQTGDFDFWQDPEKAGSIERTFDYLTKLESGGREILDSLPQWTYWLFANVQGTASGNRIEQLYNGFKSVRTGKLTHEEMRKQYLEMMDSAALLPTNVTSVRLFYILNDAPRHIRIRFKLGYAYAIQRGKDEGIAVQWGVIASVPHRIETKDDHRKYWQYQKWDVNRKSSTYFPLVMEIRPRVARVVLGDRTEKVSM